MLEKGQDQVLCDEDEVLGQVAVHVRRLLVTVGKEQLALAETKRCTRIPRRSATYLAESVRKRRGVRTRARKASRLMAESARRVDSATMASRRVLPRAYIAAHV